MPRGRVELTGLPPTPRDFNPDKCFANRFRRYIGPAYKICNAILRFNKAATPMKSRLNRSGAWSGPNTRSRSKMTQTANGSRMRMNYSGRAGAPSSGLGRIGVQPRGAGWGHDNSNAA
jgi:hypothetical protein